MLDRQDLLVEIGTEELPPKALISLAEAFQTNIQSQLEQHKLAFAETQRFASPRRLAVLVSSLVLAQKARQIERRGPALQAAFDANGQATKAALGFAGSCGTRVDQLETLDTPKGSWLVFRQTQPGKPTTDLVPEIVQKALSELPIPKRMRWGAGEAEFVRPVHWVVLLFGEEVIDAKILGVKTGRKTYGHRFLHPQPIELASPDEYEPLLRQKGYVYADAERRRSIIRDQVEFMAKKAAGCRALIDAGLLNEVTALVEWPSAIMGTFDAHFLEVPAEALIKTMQEHQKYFPVLDDNGALRPNFITISNIVSQDPDQVRAGNERVIRPRFSDAAFFWEQDLKQPLDAHIETLNTVVFQNKLGTLFEKSERIARVAETIAEHLDIDPALTTRAAQLCKCDLMSNMVGEFPSLQGIMGRYYAAKAGEAEPVSAAIEEQYLPRHAGDRLPLSGCGRAIAIADKLDTLVGIFGIGQRPSGVKDPFGLRRAALGVLRILIETPLALNLKELLQLTTDGLREKIDTSSNVADEVFAYMMDRLKAYYAEQSVQPDVVDAVLARKPPIPSDLDQRLHAVASFQKLPAAASLSAANKRIRNILRKTDDKYPMTPQIGLLEDPSEKALAQQVMALTEELEPFFAAGQYSEALSRLADLREGVDRFFDDVMVMCDNESLRHNRLALLASLSNLFLRVADLSRLQ